MATPSKINNTKSNKHYDLTESITNLGIRDIILDGDILQFIFEDETICPVIIDRSKPSLQKLCKAVKTRLSKKLKQTVYDTKLLDQGLFDIENQIISHRDEIFVDSNDLKDNNKDQIDVEFNKKFYEEVERLRQQFSQASDPYKEWQLKVAEKYKNLEKVFKSHYPEAWIFMEFALSIKSILNIKDFTLPFMGLLIAPPSSLKTMVVQLFRKYPQTFYTDSFTSSSLVSHNASLKEEELQKIDMLPKMKYKIVLTPELAPLFTGKEDELQKVLGIITRVLDGHGLENDSGAHGHRKYEDIMFVWLGAVVEIPPRVWKLLGTLGHKIYFLRPALKKKSVKDLKKIAKSNNFSSINKEIEEVLLDYLKTFDAAPEVTDKIEIENGLVKIKWNEKIEGEQDKAIEYISQVGNLIASLRGNVYVSQSKFISRKSSYDGANNFSSKDQNQQQEEDHDLSIRQQPRQLEGQDYDTDFPIIEDASRAVILLRNLAIGHAISQGRDFLVLKDVPIAIKVALSTAPIRRVRVLDLLLKSENGVLTTSQICNELSISQPVVTRTMREFDALGIADISAVSNYDNSELQIRLNHEFDWFRTDEFLDLKGDFVPYEEKKNENEHNDSDKQFVDNDRSIENFYENCFNKNDDIDNLIQFDEDFPLLENEEPCDNNKDCHTFKDNPPPETQQKNNTIDTHDIDQSKSSKNENHDLQSSHIQNQNEDLEHQSTSTSDDHNIEKNNMSLWGSNSLEHVTMSHETKKVEGDQPSFQVSSNIRENDGVKYIALQEILKAIELAHGSTIAVNSAIEIACKNNKLVRDYLGDKLTSRENRNVRDLVSNIIRHPNIKIIKNKPQLLVCWFENKDDSIDSQKGEAV